MDPFQQSRNRNGTFGKVERTDDDVKAQLMSRVRYTEHGCWIREGASAGAGYAIMSVNGKLEYCHRISYKLFVGPLEDDMQACHKCEAFSDEWRRCINPNHLFKGTKSDNMQDALRKGRFSRGDQHMRPCAKIDEDMVREIRQMKLEGYTTREIGAEFGLAHGTVSKICTFKLWAHIK